MTAQGQGKEISGQKLHGKERSIRVRMKASAWDKDGDFTEKMIAVQWVKSQGSRLQKGWRDFRKRYRSGQEHRLQGKKKGLRRRQRPGLWG